MRIVFKPPITSLIIVNHIRCLPDFKELTFRIPNLFGKIVD